jgi:hypothetical protein
MALDVSSVWIGATTDTTARVKARLTAAGSGTLLVADNEAMSGPVSFGPVASGAHNVIDWNVTGLDPGTRYWVVVDDGALNPSFKAQFLTHPAAIGERVSYIFGAAGDAGLTGVGNDSYITSAVSNNPVFDTMREQGAAEQWLWFSHLGDLHYRNISANDVSLFRTAYFENMNFGALVNPAARQSQFFRSVASTYIWDDHDYGGNDSNRTTASNPAANQVYREWVPHYPLGSGGSTGIYQSWQVGRVLYVATDSRSFRDPNSDPQGPSKTLLGTAQKTWFENLLTSNAGGAEVLVWQSSSRWIGGTDTYSSFEHERDELVQMFGDTGWLGRMIFMTADEHALSICSGPYNPYGRFPMFMFASMDSSYAATNSTAIYDVGQLQGRQQYGTMRVTDNGHTISMTGTGYINGTVWKAYTKHVHVGGTLIALDYTAGDVSEPFEPTDDDQKVRNEITAQRVDGGEYTYSKTTGPNNINDPAEDPDGIGVYDERIQLNVATDEQLPDMAAWRVHLSTVDEDRYPSVRIDLAKNPDLADEMTGLYLGDRMTVSTPPPWMAPDTINLIAEGGTETIGHPNDWDVVLNASPGSPWIVAQLPASEATAGPNLPNRLDTSASELVAAVTDSATSLVVHTPPDGIFARAPWIISTGLSTAPNLKAAQFPFDVRLGGETVRVTACAPYAWDDFARTTSNGWGTSSSGAVWTVANAPASEFSTNGSVGQHSVTSVNASRYTITPSPAADLDLRVDGATSALAAGGSQFLHLVARYVDANNLYAARLGFTTTQTLQLVIQRRVAGTQTDLLTVTVPGVHAAGTFYTIRFQLDGTTLRAKGWRASEAEPEQWQATVTDTSLTAAGSVGARSTLSSTNTNTLPVTVSYDNFEITTPQRMTVTRSINTVVKAQAAGTAVSLAQPATVAL